MNPKRVIFLGVVFLTVSFVASCDPTRVEVSKPSGFWNVYRTFEGSVEQGPDATSWSSTGTGYGIGMHSLCTRYFLDDMGLSGEIHGDQLTLSSSTAQWSGTVQGDSMSGTLTETRGSGTWRAVRTAAATCNLYEVWGGDTALECGSTAGYHPESNGYTLLGTATSTQSFAGSSSFSHYVIVTRDFNITHVDAVLCSDGAYYGTTSTGNTSDWDEIAGPPDGQAATVGAGTMGSGGYVTIDPADATTSITVYIAPAG
jgi:hypothetical protein